MMHGVQGYFVERARSTRRVAALALALGTLVLGSLLALMLPTFKRPLDEMARETARFGFEGADQYVQRITLQQLEGSSPVLRDIGAVDERRERAGGRVRARRQNHPSAIPETNSQALGPGQSDQNMTMHAVSRQANVPVVRSNDLVIEYASLPVYPEAESERGIEGRVMVQALIDTTGRVVDVQLLGSSGIGAFERSAAEAVWQYRFRPYRPSGMPSEVYAIFRFAFRVY